MASLWFEVHYAAMILCWVMPMVASIMIDILSCDSLWGEGNMISFMWDGGKSYSLQQRRHAW